MHRFILHAIDPDFGCPVLEAMLRIEDLEALRAILGPAAADDPDLEKKIYTLDPDEVAAINRRFGLAFDPEGRVVRLTPGHSIRECPYLIHTGYELFLLIEGTKKFAAMGEFGSDRHHDEDLFDRYVADGRLHKEVHVDPITPPVRTPDGAPINTVREVFYTPKGEEWRVTAWRLISNAARAAGWNDTLERLQGMLFGYQPDQIAWWLTHIRARGAWGSVPIYCAVTAGELAWLETAGYRALPKLDADQLALTSSHERPDAGRIADLWDRAASVALICVPVNIRFIIALAETQGVDPRESLDCALPAARLPDFNQNIVDSIEVYARR